MKTLFATAFTLLGCGVASAQTWFVPTAQSNKNVLIEEFTGINCQYCPDGHKKTQDFAAANPGRVMLVNFHAGGFATPGTGQPDFQTAFGTALDAYYNASGYPAAVVQRHNFGSGLISSSRPAWISNGNTTLGQSAIMNIAARANVNLDTRVISVEVQTYYTGNGTGTDNLNVWLLQNHVEGPQVGAAAWNPGAILPNGKYDHKHMFRYSFTPQWGDTIQGTAQGNYTSKTYTYTAPASIVSTPLDLANIEIGAFVADSVLEVRSAKLADITYTTSVTVGTTTPEATITEALGTVCGATTSPTIKFRNAGSTAISSVQVSYTVNGGAAQTYTYTPTTTISTMGTVEFSVPNIALPSQNNTIDFTITQINGQAFSGPNNTATVTANTAAAVTTVVDSATFTITFDTYATETSFSFKDETTGQTIASAQFAAANNSTTLTRKFPLVDGHCYLFEVKDSYGDGICCQYGNGSVSFGVGTTNLITSNGQYGSGVGSKFVWTRQPSGVNEAQTLAQGVRLYPNPTADQLNLEFQLADASDLQIQVVNSLGQVVKSVSSGNMAAGLHLLQVQTSELPNGAYFISIRQSDKVTSHRFQVIR